MKTLPAAPTPAELTERLAAPPGSKVRFGGTATQVLETCALIAAASSSWDKDTIRTFQEQQDLNPKVWDKLIAIHKDQRLESLEALLPASYTALYALVVMSDEELEVATAADLIRPNASSRSILDWTKTYRLKGSGIEQEVPLTLVLKADLSSEQRQDLLRALQRVAEDLGADLVEGKSGIKQSDLKADARKSRAEDLDAELIRLLGPVVSDAPEDLRSKFGIQSALDLIEGRRDTFTGFLQVLEGKVQETFWRKYGRAYCLKIARDFNLTDSRAERYQFKKRLEDAAKKWKGVIDGFDEVVKEVLATYMTR